MGKGDQELRLPARERLKNKFRAVGFELVPEMPAVAAGCSAARSALQQGLLDGCDS